MHTLQRAQRDIKELSHGMKDYFSVCVDAQVLERRVRKKNTFPEYKLSMTKPSNPLQTGRGELLGLWDGEDIKSVRGESQWRTERTPTGRRKGTMCGRKNSDGGGGRGETSGGARLEEQVLRRRGEAAILTPPFPHSSRRCSPSGQIRRRFNCPTDRVAFLITAGKELVVKG